VNSGTGESLHFLKRKMKMEMNSADTNQMVRRLRNQIVISGDKITKAMKSGMRNGAKIIEKVESKNGVTNGKST